MKGFKPKDIKAMSAEVKVKKLKELKFELVKAKASTGQGSSSAKQIKKAIARILTLQ